MALSKKTFLALLVFALLSLSLIDAGVGHKSRTLSTIEGENTPPQRMDCGAACDARCRLSSRSRLCKRACGTCCARCNCVPSGTAGNLEQCPCYANLTTHGGRRKCP